MDTYKIKSSIEVIIKKNGSEEKEIRVYYTGDFIYGAYDIENSEFYLAGGDTFDLSPIEYYTSFERMIQTRENILVQLAKIAEEICNEYCKFCDQVNKGEISQKEFSERCDRKCPLNRLL